MILRTFKTLRTAHLVLLEKCESGMLVYRESSYDFDANLLARVPAHRLGTVATLRHVVSPKITTIETNEPAMIAAWPYLLVIAVAVRARNALARLGLSSPVRLVAYAIEHNNIAASFADFSHTPRPIADRTSIAIFTYLTKTYSRIAFGTSSALKNYSGTLPEGIPVDLEIAQFSALPIACECRTIDTVGVLAFVGELSPRKGIPQLMELWESLVSTQSSADSRLIIVGKGELQELVEAWASDREEVEVYIDPPRSVIHEILSKSSALASIHRFACDRSVRDKRNALSE